MADFSSITSQRAVEAARLTGVLSKALLLPAEIGGEDRPGNVVYIPGFIAETMRVAVSGLIGAIRAGMVNVSVVPEYRGESFVPTKIIMTASRPGAQPEYEAKIGIW